MKPDASEILSIWNPTGQCFAAEYVASKKEFYPICANKFDKKVCGIRPGVTSPCSNCLTKEYVRLDAQLIEEHIAGRRRVGIYPLIKDVTPFVAADIDGHTDKQDPHTDVKKLVEVSTALDVPVYIFSSNGGNGYHVSLIFEEPIKAGSSGK
jgi:hypothetical protein